MVQTCTEMDPFRGKRMVRFWPIHAKAADSPGAARFNEEDTRDAAPERSLTIAARFSTELAKSLESIYAGDSFMAMELVLGSLQGVTGSVRYSKPFGG